jgi:hypothetical protein
MTPANSFTGTTGHYNRFADTWVRMSTQAQAKTLWMIKKSLLARLAPTKAPHVHVRMTRYPTSQEGEYALLAAEAIDVPDVGVDRTVVLPSARVLLAAATDVDRSSRNSDSDSEDGPQSLRGGSSRGTSTDADSVDGLDDAGYQLLRSSNARAGAATNEVEGEGDKGNEGDEGDKDDEQGEENDSLGSLKSRPVAGEKRKRGTRDHGTDSQDSRPARRTRASDSDVD